MAVAGFRSLGQGWGRAGLRSSVRTVHYLFGKHYGGNQGALFLRQT